MRNCAWAAFNYYFLWSEQVSLMVIIIFEVFSSFQVISVDSKKCIMQN